MRAKALVAYCLLFWGGDIKRTYQASGKGKYNDKHHEHMVEHYHEVPWYWYAAIIFF